MEGNPAHCPLHIPTCGLPILSPRSAKGDHFSVGRPPGPVSVIDSGTLVHAGEVREASGASISMTWPLTLPPSFPASGLCFLDTSCHTGSCSLLSWVTRLLSLPSTSSLSPVCFWGHGLTKATVPIVREDEARGAEAPESPRAVSTGAKEAEVGLLQALVNV